MNRKVPEHLAELEGWIWGRLAAAVAEEADPWRTPVLATLGSEGPAARIVVLREAAPGERRVAAFSDSRAPKIAQALGDPRTAWVFYDPRLGVQLRVRVLLDPAVPPALVASQWARVAPANRRNYRGRCAPGTVLEAPLGEELEAEQDSHFAVLRGRAVEMDWLHLGADGCRRARLTWGGAGWTPVWLAP